MEQLTDFKPFNRVALPQLGNLDTRGLTLIVGANSSGKTQFLHDLHSRLQGDHRSLVVAEAVEVTKPHDLDELLECMEREGYFTRVIDNAGNEQLRPLTTYLGTGAAASPIGMDNPRQWFSRYDVEYGQRRKRVDFLWYFGQFLVTALFLDKRLVSVNQVPMFDFETSPPQNELHALYVDDVAKAALLREVQQTFGKTVWPDASRGSVLCLRVGDTPELPSPVDRLSPRTMSGFRTIETEGDGLKSYVATCTAMLLGRRPVCLLDEPEMCLHPPQAYNLGRFIGQYGTSEARATFVATHSSHVLRGVVQTAARVQIVRLSRHGGGFQAHYVPADVIADVLTKPTLRAETVLDGIFAQAVVVVEADTDRTLYESVVEQLREEIRLDIHFTAVGGSGGIADTCSLYRTLRIPVAVIADLDVLVDTSRLQSILESLGEGEADDRILEEARRLSNKIKALPPTVMPDDVRKRLSAIAAQRMDWNKNDDRDVARAARELARDLSRQRRLKEKGIDGLPEDLRGPAARLLAMLCAKGLFLVPVGELEQWLKYGGITVSPQNKWAWTNAAVATVQSGAREDDVWGFMMRVATYLAAENDEPLGIVTKETQPPAVV